MSDGFRLTYELDFGGEEFWFARIPDIEVAKAKVGKMLDGGYTFRRSERVMEAELERYRVPQDGIAFGGAHRSEKTSDQLEREMAGGHAPIRRGWPGH